MDWSTLFPALIPVVTPLLIAGVKKLIPFISKPLLPIIAILLGALIDILSSLATGTSMNPIYGAVLGAAGIGLREVVDQVKKAASA